eukprot:COSAG01_NODE_3709_length_5770_cov_23.698819_2_plen_132_part_00
MAIPAAAEFLFCRFRRFREMFPFLSDVQSSVPGYRLQLYNSTACRAERMYVNQKAILGCKSITYVGYSVSYDGVSADPDKVEAIQDMPDTLVSKKQVRIFLGKIMFFSAFVLALGEYTNKLFGLLKWHIGV